MAEVVLRFWAAARDAAGCAEEKVTASTLDAALSVAAADRDVRFREVLARSSYLVDGHPVGSRPHSAVALAEGSVVEVLPPFAGG